MIVHLVWDEFHEAAYVGFRRGLVAVHKRLRDDERLVRPHFGESIDGAVAEKVVSKGLGLYWPAHLQPNRALGDLVDHDGTPLEVRHTHRLDGCFPLHREDPDQFRPVLVRGRYPRFELITGNRLLAELKRDQFWRDGLDRPCFLVPAHVLLDPEMTGFGEPDPLSES